MKVSICSPLLALLWAAISVPASAEPADATQSGRVAESVPTHALTLEDALLLAREENPELRAATGGLEAAEGRAWQLGRWSNPALELSVEDWLVSHGGSFSDAKQTIGISQQLPWPGKKKYARALGRTGTRLSQAELALRQTEVTRDVKAAFHRVLAAEAAHGVGEELLCIARSSAEAARKRVDAGATAYQEQLRAEIQLGQVQTEVAALQLQVEDARQMLFTLLGRPQLVLTPLAGSLRHSCDPQLLAASPESWQPQHPSQLAAEAGVRLAQLEANRAQLDPYPDVTAAVAGGRIGETDQSIVQFGLSIPLPLFDSAKGRQAEAAAQVTVAQAQRDAVQLTLLRELTQATRRYQTAGQQVQSYREQILPKSSEALRLVQTGFEEGKFSFIDLLDTQRTFAESQLAYQQKLLELNIAQAELEALVRPCPVLDPSSNHP